VHERGQHRHGAQYRHRLPDHRPGAGRPGRPYRHRSPPIATDIPLSAYGRGASLFSGVMDNTDVFFKIAQAIPGGAK